MDRSLYSRKLEESKTLIVPAIFTDRQLRVLIKKLENKTLSQTEKNYLSNAIKTKIKAIGAIKHLNFDSLYEHKKNLRPLVNSIVKSYRDSGIELLGYEEEKAIAMQPTFVVKEVISHYKDIDARLVDLLPVYILKNLGKIRLFEIYDFAIENNLVNFTGYIFNVLYTYFPTEAIKDFLISLEKRKDKVLIARDKRYELISDLIEQDIVSRKWNILTLNKVNDYKNYFKLYAEAS